MTSPEACFLTYSRRRCRCVGLSLSERSRLWNEFQEFLCLILENFINKHSKINQISSTWKMKNNIEICAWQFGGKTINCNWIWFSNSIVRGRAQVCRVQLADILFVRSGSPSEQQPGQNLSVSVRVAVSKCFSLGWLYQAVFLPLLMRGALGAPHFLCVSRQASSVWMRSPAKARLSKESVQSRFQPPKFTVSFNYCPIF